MKSDSGWRFTPYILILSYVVLISYNFFSLTTRVNYLFEHPVHVL